MTVFNDNKTLVLRGILVLLIILISDQLSKEYMMGLLLEPQRSIEITSFFAFTPVWNYGVSFGMFKAGDAKGVYLLVAVSTLITSVVGYWLWRATTTLQAVMYGLIIGGAIGNVIDRLRFGAVFDFLDFHYKSFYYPVFNIADSAICVGVFLILLEQLRGKKHSTADIVENGKNNA